ELLDEVIVQLRDEVERLSPNGTPESLEERADPLKEELEREEMDRRVAEDLLEIVEEEPFRLDDREPAPATRAEPSAVQEPASMAPALSPDIIESLRDAFVAMDSDGRITEWNMAAEEMFGWNPAEVIGETLADTLVPEEFREAHRAGLARFLETGE